MTPRLHAILTFLFAFLALSHALFAPQAAFAQNDIGRTLSQTLKRGYVSCGVTQSAGFAEIDPLGAWRGFDIDLCRAVAAAIFDNPAKTQFVEIAAKERVNALQLGWFDLLVSAPPWTLSRDAGQHVDYAGISFFDGQSFLVRRERSFGSAKDLDGVSICVVQDTSYELDLADYFEARKFVAKPFGAFEEARAAYDGRQCDALTGDVSVLHAARAKLAAPDEHAVLPDLLSKAPRGPLVREDDQQWLKIVRWTLYAMINAEELNVSRTNADQSLKSENSHIRRLLGVDGDRGAGLGLSANWAYRIVKHVGNYGDVFEQNLGPATPLRMERRQNALWSKSGLIFAPPVH